MLGGRRERRGSGSGTRASGSTIWDSGVLVAYWEVGQPSAYSYSKSKVLFMR